MELAQPIGKDTNKKKWSFTQVIGAAQNEQHFPLYLETI